MSTYPLIISHKPDQQDTISFGPQIWLGENRQSVSFIYGQQPNPRKFAPSSFSMGRYKGYNFFIRTLCLDKVEKNTNRIGELFSIGIAARNLSCKALYLTWLLTSSWAALPQAPNSSVAIDWEDSGIRSLIDHWKADAEANLYATILKTIPSAPSNHPGMNLMSGFEGQVSAFLNAIKIHDKAQAVAIDPRITREALYTVSYEIMRINQPIFPRNWLATVLMVAPTNPSRLGALIIDARRGNSGLVEISQEPF